MKKRMIWVTVAVAIFAGRNALSQEDILDHLIDACEGDIVNYCSQVTPGDGRLLHCMAAHEDKVSGQCHYAFYQAAALLEQLSVALAYLVQECKTEIQSLCSDLEVGNGRLLVCLDEHDEDVGQGCKKAVADTVGE